MTEEQVLTEEALAAYIQQLSDELETERPALEARMAALIRERQQARLRVDRLLDALEQGVAGPSVSARLRDREEALEEVEKQIRALESRLAGADGLEDWNVQQFRATLSGALDKGPRPAARRLLAAIIEEVVVGEEVLRVRYRYPFARLRMQRVGPLGFEPRTNRL